MGKQEEEREIEDGTDNVMKRKKNDPPQMVLHKEELK